MGCDIHGVVEQRIKDRWVTIRTLHYPTPILERNYLRFAELAGVRGDGPAPLGLPEDVSETAKALSDAWDSDGHSHSYMPLKDAAKIAVATHRWPDADRCRRYDDLDRERVEKFRYWYFFRVEPIEATLADYRFVFWFDN